VLKAVENVKLIEARVKGMNVLNQAEIDRAMIELDGTPNKSKLGANAILGVSMSVARAAACHKNMHLWQYLSTLSSTKPVLPYPYLNVINGGKHADNHIACQEFMICPEEAASFGESMRIGCEVYHRLKDIIKKRYGATGVGDEGGFAPGSRTMDEALEMLMQAIAPSKGVRIALDVAASEFFVEESKKYDLGFKAEKRELVSGSELGQTYLALAQKYPIKSIEDPFDQDDT
jgi:enolase